MSNTEKPDKNFVNLLKQEFEAFEGKFELLEDNSGVKISIGEVFGVRNNRITVIYKAMERVVAFNKNFHDQILETLGFCRLAFYSHWDFQRINQNTEDAMCSILQDKNVGFWVAFRIFRYIFAKGYHHIDFIDHDENDPCCFAIRRYGTYMYFSYTIEDLRIAFDLVLFSSNNQRGNFDVFYGSYHLEEFKTLRSLAGSIGLKVKILRINGEYYYALVDHDGYRVCFDLVKPYTSSAFNLYLRMMMKNIKFGYGGTRSMLQGNRLPRSTGGLICVLLRRLLKHFVVRRLKRRYGSADGMSSGCLTSVHQEWILSGLLSS